jgi:hypothetical protein
MKKNLFNHLKLNLRTLLLIILTLVLFGTGIYAIVYACMGGALLEIGAFLLGLTGIFVGWLVLEVLTEKINK